MRYKLFENCFKYNKRVKNNYNKYSWIISQKQTNEEEVYMHCLDYRESYLEWIRRCTYF